MALLEGVALEKRFGGVVALDGVSVSIEQGETVGLIGPNGAGKTTLFELLAGVHTPNAGRVEFHGEDVTGWSPHVLAREGLVKTHQIARPFEDMTLVDNVSVGAQFAGDATDPDTVARETLEFVGLDERSDERPDGLSIGALKRLELARVLATDPDVILLDEVAGGLDPDETETLIELVEAIRHRGHTVFLIDHVMRALMAVSDRVLVLDGGELIAKGPPDRIRDDDRVKDAYLGDATNGVLVGGKE